MSLLLAIESSTSVCSVCLYSEDVVLANLELHQANVHAQKLMILIDQLFEHTGFKVQDLKGVAVSAGPGSYTGLRIAVSIAKGLAYALEIPLIAVDSLEALAWQAIPYAGENDLVVPMMDARRMEVYAAVFGYGGSIVMATQPILLDQNPFAAFQEKGKLFYLGDGVSKAREVLAHPDAVFLNLECSSRTVASIAYSKLRRGDFVDTVYFEPNYLKEFRVLQSKKNSLLI